MLEHSEAPALAERAEGGRDDDFAGDEEVACEQTAVLEYRCRVLYFPDRLEYGSLHVPSTKRSDKNIMLHENTGHIISLK